MSDRTFQWWRFKLGFRGDEEFVQLALLAPDRRTYLAALGLLLTVYDAAHKSDSRRPRGTIVAPDGDLLALLVDAGILEPGGAVPEGTWSKYRVGDRPRGDDGRFQSNNHVAPYGHHRGPDTETEREMSSDRTKRKQNDVRSEGTPRASARLEPISETLKEAPWNKRK